MMKWGFRWRYDNSGIPHKIGIAFWSKSKVGNLLSYNLYLPFPKFLVHSECR